MHRAGERVSLQLHLKHAMACARFVGVAFIVAGPIACGFIVMNAAVGPRVGSIPCAIFPLV